jgi:predicted dehydrogenase
MKSVIIIGVGRMGRRHLAVSQKLGLNIIGIFDLSSESLKTAQDEYNLSDDLLFSDLDKLFDETNADCAIIATTADSHCNLTCLAAVKGIKYILVEKPMAVSIEECDMMINICKLHGSSLAINHQMRFMEQYKTPKELLNSQFLGGLKSMTVLGGNMGFSMNAIHYFEAFRFLTDELPLEITAWISDEELVNPRGSQFIDKAGSIRIKTSKGIRLYIDINSDQGHGAQVIYFGKNGSISVDELSGDMRVVCRQEAFRELPTTRYGMPADITLSKIKSVDIIDSSASVLNALLNGNDLNVSGQDGKLAVQTLCAAYKSGENNNMIISLFDDLNYLRKYPWA